MISRMIERRYIFAGLSLLAALVVALCYDSRRASTTAVGPTNLEPVLLLETVLFPERQSGFFDRMKNGDMNKLGSILGSIIDARDNALSPLLVTSNTLLVEVIGQREGSLKEALLASTKVNIINCILNFCSVEANVDELVSMSRLPEVQFVRPSSPLLEDNLFSKIKSQGLLNNTDRLLKTGGSYIPDATGKGVSVCVLSDSFNCLGGAAADIASGALPEDLEVMKDLTRDQCRRMGTDRGRAMLQVIHQVAPEAMLGFRTAVLGEPDLIVSIMDMIDAGCDIIVDDVRYLSEPYFQDGLVAQAADVASSEGIPYFSAAGHFQGNVWEGPFQPSGDNLLINGTSRGERNLFSLTDGIQVGSLQVTFVNVDTPVQLGLQWDQPFSIADNAGSANDLDIFLFFEDVLFAASIDNNIGQSPYESIVLIPADLRLGRGDTFTLDMVITLTSGPAPGYVKIIANPSNDVTFQVQTWASPTFGQANAQLTTGVAAPYFDVPRDRQSDSGASTGTSILFDADGTRLDRPLVRQQPRFTGEDGQTTTFFGEGPGNHFFGAGASAAYVAGVSALILQLLPDTNPDRLYRLLDGTTVPLDDPFTPGFDQGYNFATGSGIVDKDTVLKYVSTLLPPPETSTSGNGGSKSSKGSKRGKGGKGSSKSAQRRARGQ